MTGADAPLCEAALLELLCVLPELCCVRPELRCALLLELLCVLPELCCVAAELCWVAAERLWAGWKPLLCTGAGAAAGLTPPLDEAEAWPGPLPSGGGGVSAVGAAGGFQP